MFASSKDIYLKYSIFLFALSIIIACSIPLFTGNIQLPKEILPVVILFVLLTGILIKLKEGIPPVISFLILVGFIVKSIYFYFVYNTIISPFPDTFLYLTNLQDMQYTGLGFSEIASLAGSLQFGHYYYMYGVLTVFGTTYSLYVANIFLFSLTSVMFYKIVKKDFGTKIAGVTVISFLLSTNMLLFSGHILKDSLVLFLMMLSLYTYKLSKRKYLVIIPLILLFLVRIYAGGAIVVAIVFHLLFISEISIRKKFLASMFGLLTFLGVSAFSFSTNYINIISSFVSGNSLVDMVINPIISLFKFYFSPLFWNLIVGQDHYLILFTDSFLAMLFSFAVLLFVIKFLRDKDLRKKMWIYLIPIIIHAFALGIEYGGDSTRQRIGVFGFIILTYVVGALYKPMKIDKGKTIKL